MGLGDCLKCWSSPCDCGWDYRWMPKASRIDLASKILGVPVLTLRELDRVIPEDHPRRNEK